MDALTEPERGRAAADAEWALGFITKVVEACPRRVMGSDSERRAHDLLADELRARDVEPTFQDFHWNRSLYATMALHFTLACVATGLFFVSPPAAFALHTLVAVSYLLDSTRKAHLLRRLFPQHPSRNLIATLPAKGAMRRRVVLISHIDAAYTGLVFEPGIIKLATHEPPFRFLRPLRKQMLVTTGSVALCALVDLAAWLSGGSPALVGLVVALTIPAFIAAALNIDVVLRDEIVGGANDNLTGCAGGVLLLDRLGDDKPADVELVFVATGAEEAGTGGAHRLAEAMSDQWGKDDTVIVAIDGLTNGEMRYMEDGEILRLRIPRWLEAIAAEVADEPRFEQVRPFQIPAGGSDATPFEAMGWPGIALVCIDPDIGAPRHYHHPTDIPENLDMAQFLLSMDYAEQVVRRIWAA